MTTRFNAPLGRPTSRFLALTLGLAGSLAACNLEADESHPPESASADAMDRTPEMGSMQPMSEMESMPKADSMPETESMDSMPRTPSSEQTSAPTREDLPQLPFIRADLFKPRMDDAIGIDPYSAPLLYIDASAANSDADNSPLGTVRQGANGDLELDPSRPAVYFAESTVQHGERELRQQRFIWFRQIGATIHAQGLRLTFDSKQFPAVFEVLQPPSTSPQLYVSATLEAKAQGEFGAPTSDRKFALELEHAGPSHVHGALASGPMPMGPYAYQSQATADILQLHCRCSPTEADAIRATIEYELTPLSEIEPLWPLIPDADFADPKASLGLLRIPTDV